MRVPRRQLLDLTRGPKGRHSIATSVRAWSRDDRCVFEARRADTNLGAPSALPEVLSIPTTPLRTWLLNASPSGLFVSAGYVFVYVPAGSRKHHSNAGRSDSRRSVDGAGAIRT